MTEQAVWIATADGERLAATLYLPDGDGPFAALMEALPYRKDDITVSYRDSYERFAANGFAVLRVDLRGTGSSTGVITDEYPDIERSDLRTAIEWLASQPWSNGNVGMFGTSYSGFNSLQMAAENVPALRAVAAMYATDDRYTDDVHYCGGVLRALDLIDYPLYMIAMNALPPVPAEFGEGWRDEWLRRAEQSPAWLMEWLEHPVDGPTWRRGSIRRGPDGDGYQRMSCPTMLIVGWADGYRNNSFRVVEQYERNGMPWRLLAGPWVHKDPARARPGPNLDCDAELIAFFDEHLRNGAPSRSAKGQVYVRQPVEPEHDLSLHPGVWRDIESWPPTGLRLMALRPDADRGVERHVVRGDVGVAAWNSCGGGLPWGQPLDQRDDNARSITYDWPIVDRAEVAGHARVSLRVRSDQTFGHVSIKLCDVFPNGASALITRGMLDLTHVGCWPADGFGEVGRAPSELTPDEWIDVVIELEATTWTLEPGHVLRVAIAGTDWPNCWPPPGPVTLHVDSSALELAMPIVEDLPESTHVFGSGLGPSDDEAEGVTWCIERDVIKRETRVSTRYGGPYEGAHGARIIDDYQGELGVSWVDPSQAWARGTSSFEITWPELICRSEATLTVTSDAQSFHVNIELTVTEDGNPVTTRAWSGTLPRRSDLAQSGI